MSLKLLTPVTLGGKQLKNRIALAPMTRARATDDFVPTPVMGEYFTQRSGAGFVITDATGISKQGLGWAAAPAIFNDKHVEGWKPIVEKVHNAGGTFCLQLWHMGRQVHSGISGQKSVAPSAIAPGGEVPVNGKMVPYETPEELTKDGIKQIIEDYVQAAKNAKEAGFEFVEVHSANGYLLDTFIQSSTNKRTDEYGGSIENRLRALKEVLDAVSSVYPTNRVGVRLSPNGVFGTMGSEDNFETFSEAVKLVGGKKLAYLHLMDGLGFGFHDKCPEFKLRHARDILNKTPSKGETVLMGNVGYTRALAEERLQADDADMIAFGRPFISNPDLPARFAQNLDGEPPLNPDADQADWWTPNLGAKGYTDFPTL